METANKEKKISYLTGVVSGHKMDKTAIVLVERTVKHKKYNKKFKSSKRYKAHDEKNEYNVGDKVVFQSCRPMSKEKKWRIIKKVD
ncbi:30S ribosomal protein S17 [Patescibacteria group bacterium]|nr:30S ribosomal protein S17 [Patescibacteria group bacterium]